MTLYRMTMQGVYDLEDKDSGDLAGDAGFVLLRRDQAYQCSLDPDAYSCKDRAQFSGDEANSTDLVIELKVEVDG